MTLSKANPDLRRTGIKRSRLESPGTANAQKANNASPPKKEAFQKGMMKTATRNSSRINIHPERSRSQVGKRFNLVGGKLSLQLMIPQPSQRELRGWEFLPFPRILGSLVPDVTIFFKIFSKGETPGIVR